MKRFLLVVSLVGVCLLALSPLPSQASPEGIPPGVYVTNVTAADVPPGLPPEIQAALVGEWSLELTGNGIYLVHKDGAFGVMGSYTTNSARLVMHDELGPFACTEPGQATAVYDWSFDGESLTLRLIHDNCLVRVIPATAHPFELQ